MALTSELLSKIEGLTDDQIKALVELSANEENRVISTKLGEVHWQYDKDFQEVTGLEKPQGVKSYTFWKEQMASLQKKASEGATSLEAQIKALSDEKQKLVEQLKTGNGSEAFKQQIADKEALIAQLQKKTEEVNSDWLQKYTQAQQENQQLLLNVEFNKAMADPSIKFKSDSLIPAEVRKTFIDNAKGYVTSEYQPDWVDNGQGGKALVFRGKDGEIVRNPDNALKPFTAAELLTKQLKPIIDEGKKGAGAGAGPNNNGRSSMVGIGEATTQSQAAEMITEALMSKGLPRGTDEYQKEFDKAWADSNVTALPIR